MKKEEFEKKHGKIFTIPNVLSFVRLGMIPFIIWLYCFEKNYPITTLLIVLSGLTDLVDGFIARKFNMISDLGKALDPIADKLTQVSMLFCLVTRFKYMLIPLTFFILKELFAGIMELIRIKKTSSVRGALWHGKLNTFLLYGMMTIHIIWYNIPIAVSNILILISTSVMLLSAILYGIQGITHLSQIRKKEKGSKKDS